MKRPASLQARLLGLIAAAMLVVWSAATVAIWIDAREELDELLDGHLAQAAALLVVQQAREIEEDHQADAPSLHKYAPKVAFQVFHEGQLVLRSANAPEQPMAPVRRAREGGGFHDVTIAGEAWRVFTTFGAERDVTVHVGEQRASRAAILRAVLQSALWPLLAALPLLAAAAWWAIRSGVAPLRRLGALIAARQAGELQPVRVPGAPSEMTPLVDALNGLFERIAVLLDAERRFTADAAHELRTPVAAVRAQAQVALRETDDRLRAHALQSALQGCDRASRVVEQLLTLARLEADGAHAASPVELAGLARKVLAELAPAAVARRQSLELEAPQPRVVRGDETLLALLLRNVIDNALRYSPEGTRVLVRVRANGQGAVVTVDDGGPGLSPQELGRLGERFFRAQRGEAEGSGLGWSIARRIAAVHGASMEAGRSDELGGLAVRIEFPARKA